MWHHYVWHLLKTVTFASPHYLIALPLIIHSYRLQRGWVTEVLAAAHTYGGVCDTHSPI